MKSINRLATVALLALAPLSLAAPARADEASRSFEHEGVTYRYTVVDRGRTTVLRGVAERGRTETPFSLRVRGGRVRGQVGLSEVSFPLSDVQPVVSGMALASR